MRDCLGQVAEATVFLSPDFPAGPVVFGSSACPLSGADPTPGFPYLGTPYLQVPDASKCANKLGPSPKQLYCKSSNLPVKSAGNTIAAGTELPLNSGASIKFDQPMTDFSGNGLGTTPFLMSATGTTSIEMTIKSNNPADRIIGLTFTPAYQMAGTTNAKTLGLGWQCFSENVPDAAAITAPFGGAGSPPSWGDSYCPTGDPSPLPCPGCNTGECAPYWFYYGNVGTTATSLGLTYASSAYFWLQDADAPASVTPNNVSSQMSITRCTIFRISPGTLITSVGLRYSADDVLVSYFSNACPS